MKADIHPEYHEIEVVLTNGSSFKTRSTWGKPGEKMQLDIDPTTHPAWVGGVSLRKTGRTERFANQFGDMDFLKKKDS